MPSDDEFNQIPSLSAEERAEIERLAGEDDKLLAGLPQKELSDALAEKISSSKLIKNLNNANLNDFSAGSSCNKEPIREWVLPSEFGQFRILRMIGQGSFAKVWEAFDQRLNRTVAIKALHPDRREDPRLVDRFIKEGQAAAKLNHPNIVRVHETGKIDGIAYIASEFVKGHVLQTLDYSKPFFTPHQTAELCEGIADGVDHSHSRGVFHRDIKPENILLEETIDAYKLKRTVPRLTDFGLAWIENVDSGSNQPHQVVGTFEYMSPEQLLRKTGRGDTQSDIYAVGLVMYEMLTGLRARRASRKPSDIANASSEINPPRSLQPNIPKDLDAICMRCLAVDPEERYRTAADLKRDLRCFLEGRPTLARPLSYPQRISRIARRNPLAARLLALSATSILIAFLMVWEKSRNLRRSNNELIETKQRLQRTNTDLETIAWQYGLSDAFNNFQMGRMRIASNLADEIKEKSPENAKNPAWKLLRQEIDNTFRILRKFDYPLRHIVAIPGTPKVVVSGDKAELIVLDVQSGYVIKKIDLPRITNALGISSDGKMLAVAIYDAEEKTYSPWLIDLVDGKMSKLKSKAQEPIVSLAFSPDGQWLATMYRHKWVLLETVDSPGLRDLIRVDIPGTGQAVSWLGDSETIVMQTTSALLFRGIYGSTDEVSRPAGKLCFTSVPNANQVITALGDGICYFVNRFGSDDSKTLHGSTTDPFCIAVTEDGRFYAVGSTLGEIVIWAASNNPYTEEAYKKIFREPIVKCELSFESGISKFCWSGHQIVAISIDGSVCCTNSVARATDYESGHDISTATFDKGGEEILLGFTDGGLFRYPTTELMARLVARQVNVKDPKYKLQYQEDSTVMMIEIAPSREWMLVGYENRNVKILDASGKLISSVVPGSSNQSQRFHPDAYGWRVAISDDGQWVASGGLFGLRLARFNGKNLDRGYVYDRPPLLALQFLPGKSRLLGGHESVGMQLYGHLTRDGRRIAWDKNGVSLIERIPGTNRLAIGSANGELKELDSDRLLFINSVRVSGRAGYDLAISHDGTTAVWTNQNLDSFVISLESDRVLGRLRMGPIDFTRMGPIDLSLFQLHNCSTQFSANGRYFMVCHILKRHEVSAFPELNNLTGSTFEPGVDSDFFRIYDLQTSKEKQ